MTKKEALTTDTLRILKISTCPSLSGRSDLTYHIGCNTEGDIYFRVVANTGSGQFNADWVEISLVEKLLSEHPSDKPLTSTILSSMFQGRSSNSPAFLFAVLKAELLVLPGKSKDDGYLVGDMGAFKLDMSSLISGSINLPIKPSMEVGRRKRTKEAE